MNIAPINLTRQTNFKGKTQVLSAPFSNEGNLTNAQAYVGTCLLTAIPGFEFTQKGFQTVGTIGKIGKVAGGVGVMLGLAVPIFAILKLLNILCRPTGEKNNPNN